MPQAIPYISFLISVGSAIYAANLDLDLDPKDSGTLVNKAGTRATRDVVYGTARTGATPVYSNVNNNNSSQLLNVFACSIGATAVHQLYIDEVAVLNNTGSYHETNKDSLIFSGNQLTNGFEKQCHIQLRAGTEYGIPMSLACTHSDGEWTEKMRGANTAAVAILTQRIIDEESIRIMSDKFTVNMLVSGAAVYDPRTGITAFSRNPALAALDYITNDYYGMDISYEYIDIESFKSAATYCEQNHFCIDGQLNSGESFATNLDNICKCAQLKLFIENGKLTCRYETAELPSHHFDENTILEGSFKVTEQNSSSYINVVEVNYCNSELDDKSDVYTVPAVIYEPTDSPNYPTQPQKDGYIETATLDMPLVRMEGSKVNHASSTVRTFANRELLKQQFQKEISFDIDLEESAVKVFEVITVSLEAMGWDRKEFRIKTITSRISETEMNVATITCIEYSDSVYTGKLEGTPASDKPSKNVVVSAPTNLTFKLHDLVTTGTATLSWSRTWHETKSAFIVEYKASNSTAWTTLGRTDAKEWKFPALYPDNYDFRVATWSNLYGSSTWTVLNNQVVSQLAVFPPVVDLTCDTTTQDFKFSWADMLGESVSLPTDPDISAPVNPVVRDYFSHYQIDILDGSKLLASYQSTTNQYDYTYAQNIGHSKLRTITANVYIVALDGSKSQLDTGSKLTVTNRQCAAPGGISESTELSNTVITWDQPKELDYRATRFYVSEQPGFTPSDANLLKEQVGTLFSHIWSDYKTHYLRFAHVDILGNDNPVYSPEMTITAKNINALLPEFNSELTDIRNPDREQTATGEMIMNVASSDKGKIAGFGMYAKDDINSKFVIAADELVISAGGQAEYKADRTYSAGDYVTVNISDTVQELWQAKTDIPINTPPVTGANWERRLANTYQAAFYFDAVSNKLLLDTAVIENLTSDNIKSRTITADCIAADAITGNEICSTTTIIAGNQLTPQVSIYIEKLNTDAETLFGYNSLKGLGSISNDSIFGARLTGIYQSNHRYMGTFTYVVFDSAPFGIAGDIILKINGESHAIKPNGDGRTWSTPDLYLFESLPYETNIDIVFENIQLNTFAGINGYDDGSGVGVDNIRFWSGASAANAQNALFKVDSKGKLYALNAEIVGKINSSFIEGGSIKGAYIEGGNIKGTTIQTSSIITDTPPLTASWYTYQLYKTYDISSPLIKGAYYAGYGNFSKTVTSNSTATMPIAAYNYTNSQGTELERFTRKYISRIEAYGQTEALVKEYTWHRHYSSKTPDRTPKGRVRLIITGDESHTITSNILTNGGTQVIGDGQWLATVRARYSQSGFRHSQGGSDGNTFTCYHCYWYASGDITWCGDADGMTDFYYSGNNKKSFKLQLQVSYDGSSWHNITTKYICSPYNLTLPDPVTGE